MCTQIAFPIGPASFLHRFDDVAEMAPTSIRFGMLEKVQYSGLRFMTIFNEPLYQAYDVKVLEINLFIYKLV